MINDVASTTLRLRLFADPTRVRLLRLLEAQELTVAEVQRVTNLGQSRISTHLGKLREAGVLRDRRQGAATFYAARQADMPADIRRIWSAIDEQLDEPLLREDRERAAALVRTRGDGSGWPDAVAGRMERFYSPGRTWEATARGVLGLMHLGDVLDAGSGDGIVAALLASRARTVTCLDKSSKVLQAARRRLSGLRNVRFSPGDVQALPFAAHSFDHVLLMNVLTYAERPRRAIEEAARVLRPGGDLVIVTLAAHRHRAVTAGFGHLQAGFAPRTLRAWLAGAGLQVSQCEITSRERQEPHFQVVSAFARRPSDAQGQPPERSDRRSLA